MKHSQSILLSCSSHGQAPRSHKTHWLFSFCPFSYCHSGITSRICMMMCLLKLRKNGFFFPRNPVTSQQKWKTRTINTWKRKSTSCSCSVASLPWEDFQLLGCLLFLSVMRSSCTTRRCFSWSITQSRHVEHVLCSREPLPPLLLFLNESYGCYKNKDKHL